MMLLRRNKMKKDDLEYVLDSAKKREEILINHKPISQHNKYLTIMRKYARKLIEDGRQDELLPYLEDESISIRADIACLLFHFYPDKCTEILQHISNLTRADGLPEYFSWVSMAAHDNLKYGIPKDFP